MTTRPTLVGAAHMVESKQRLKAIKAGWTCLRSGARRASSHRRSRAQTGARWTLRFEAEAFALLQRVEVVGVAATLTELKSAARASGGVEVEARQSGDSLLTWTTSIFGQPADVL